MRRASRMPRLPDSTSSPVKPSRTAFCSSSRIAASTFWRFCGAKMDWMRKLADWSSELAAVEVAHGGEVGAGGAEELAVACARVVELRLAHPLDALVDGRRVVRVALGVEGHVARETHARERRGIGALAVRAADRGALHFLELARRKGRLLQHFRHQAQRRREVLAPHLDARAVAADRNGGV